MLSLQKGFLQHLAWVHLILQGIRPRGNMLSWVKQAILGGNFQCLQGFHKFWPDPIPARGTCFLAWQEETFAWNQTCLCGQDIHCEVKQVWKPFSMFCSRRLASFEKDVNRTHEPASMWGHWKQQLSYGHRQFRSSWMFPTAPQDTHLAHAEHHSTPSHCTIVVHCLPPTHAVPQKPMWSSMRKVDDHCVSLGICPGSCFIAILYC